MRRRASTPRPVNPWVTEPVAAGEQHAAPISPVVVPGPAAAPGPVWLVGAHGGAGTSTVAALTGLPQLQARPGADGHRRGGVLVVARTHAVGLVATQRLLGRARDVGVSVVGLVLVADAPGRLPRQLADLADLVTRAVAPRPAWRVPWVPALRMATPQMDPTAVQGLCPPALTGVLHEITDLAAGEVRAVPVPCDRDDAPGTQ